MDLILAEKSLAEYTKQAWNVIEPGTPFRDNWHLDVISEHLEAISAGQIRNLIINIPPRHMKSIQACVMWPSWEWGPREMPHFKYMFVSYAYDLSIRDSVKMRRVIQSQWYQERWGHVFQIIDDQNKKERYETDATGFRLATSTGGLGTGEGGDRIVVDDPHNVKDAESDTIREGVLRWWDEVMSSRLNDQEKGTKVIIMQRVHERDLSGHCLQKVDELTGDFDYEHLCLPARYEGERSKTSLEFRDPRTEQGSPLWESRFAEPQLRRLERDMGPYAAAGQLQQRPSPREGGIFKKQWWKYWQIEGEQLPPPVVLFSDGTTMECEVVSLPHPGLMTQNQSWDMSFKDTSMSDHICGGVWGKLGANAYLLDGFYERKDFPGTVNTVITMKAKHPLTRRIWVEDKANGPAVISTLKVAIPGLIGVNPEGDKVARANAVTWVIESGNVILPHPHKYPWVQPMVDQMAAFPNAAADDWVDMVSQALRKMFGGGGVDLTPLPHWIQALQ